MTPRNHAPAQRKVSSPFNYISAPGMSSTAPSASSSNKMSVDMVSTLSDAPTGNTYMSALEDFMVPTSQLQNHGYWAVGLTDEELNDKRRCTGCEKPWGKLRRLQERAQSTATKENHDTEQLVSASNDHDAFKPSTDNTMAEKLKDLAINDNRSNTNDKKPKQANPVLHCTFHTGRLERHHQIQTEDPARRNQSSWYSFDKLWSCCMQPQSAQPCCGTEHHTVLDTKLSILRDRWQLYPTPAPNPSHPSFHRMAVAIDCEMGTSISGDPELIRVTLVDYFTSETLLDRLVYPTVPMQHLNTRYSGVSWNMLNAASSRRECLRGRDAARKEVWRFVGPETVVVAHSGTNDLWSLRWRHDRILDTYLIESVRDRARRKLEAEKEAEKKNDSSTTTDKTSPIKPPPKQDITTTTINQTKPPPLTSSQPQQIPQPKPKRVKGTGPFTLKTLTKTRLGRDIQMGNKGHDSLEDALAARDLAHWLVRGVLEGQGNGKMVWDCY